MRILACVFLASCCAGGLLADVASPYGYVSHLIRPEEYPNLDRELALLDDAGTGWFRTGIRWEFLQKTPGAGDWDFSVYDDVIDKALAHGISYLPIFYVHSASRIHVERPDLWCDYVRRCVERYRGRVSHWEVWNEVNIGDRENKMSPEEYAEVLRRTYQTVKACDPHAIVTSSGFARIPFDYIERLYQLGARDCFDVMNVHFYPGMRPEDVLETQLERLRMLMAKYGDERKPVWLTEIGLRADRREKLAVPGFAAAALKAADPSRQSWRILLVEDERRRLESATRLLQAELPNCTFDGCDFRSVERRLAEDTPDALFLPLNCTYPADAMDAVMNYVSRGGTLVDMGGSSMYQPCRWKQTGMMELKDGGGHADRRRLRFDVVSPYTDSRYPHHLKLRSVGAFEKIKIRNPLVYQRYFKPVGLKPGDVFEPLLVGTMTNGLEACSAAIVRYGSDMKGRLVLSGWSEPGVSPSSRDDQAVAVARDLSVAFAAGYEKVFWYSLCDCFGLVDPKDLASGEKMPGHRAYKAFIRRRPTGSVNLAGQWRNARRTVCWPQWRRPDGTVAGAIWSIEPSEVYVTFSGKARFYNHLGESIPSPLGKAKAGKIALGPEPLFFEGAEVSVGDETRFAPLTPSAAAAEKLMHRNKPKSKAFADRFFPTYPSVCDVKKATARDVAPCLRGAVMYQLFTRMFTPEGTFKAAERKLPELKELGVDIIYLTPHQLADDDPDQRHWSGRQKASGFGNPKNPYRQKDFYAVDPEYGSPQDLKDFVAAAHRLGMKVMFDLVYFHCGPKAVFLGEHPDFIVRNADGTPRLGDWAFPEMDISRREVRDYLYANMEGFVRDYDVDGFRCDVADMLPVDFWEEGYLRCKALKPDVFMMCEGLKGDDQLQAFDLSYGFYTQWTMVELLGGSQPASMLRTAWEAQRRDYPQNFHWMRCFENHDFANVVPGEKRKEERYGAKINEAMIATCFLLDGVPMLYNGQEIADSAPHSIYSNRDHGGWHIDWSKADEPHAVRRRSLVKRLTALRHENPGLFDAPVTWLETGAPDRVFAFRRELPDCPLTLAVNVSKEPVDVQIDGKDVTVPPQSFVIRRQRSMENPDESCDIVIYGSSPAAISAAIQAKRMGRSAVVVSPETRIGGLTTGGLGQTDIGRKTAFGGIALEFYKAVAAYYADGANWTRQKPESYFPDGQCAGSKSKESMWTFEPSAALKILEGWERRDGLDIRRGEWLDRERGVVKENGRIVSIRTLSGNVYRGKVFVDATYEGDLMAAAGVSYTVGREANAVYGETFNGNQTAEAKSHQLNAGVDPYVVKGDPKSGLLFGVEPYDPAARLGDGDRRVQAYCFRMCLTDDPANRIPFKKPEGYDERDYELLFRHLALAPSNRIDMPWINSKMPNRKTDTNNSTGFSTDFIGQNWAWPEATYADREKIRNAHLKYQRGLMWTLANHPRVPEKIRKEVSKWGTCRDEFADGLGDGWQSQLYVREARRMVGEYVMTDHNCWGTAVAPKPVAMGAYHMDSHHVRRHVGADGFVHNEGDIQVSFDAKTGRRFRPYPIGYGAVVPKRGECENLIVPVCVSASHIAFGSIRMEPVFFALGQVAGTAGAIAAADGIAVQDVPYAELSARLLSDGQVLGFGK